MAEDFVSVPDHPFSRKPLLHLLCESAIAKSSDILSILDRACDAYTFPMLDNGYVYLAATRLSLYRSKEDWAMVIEIFGFSPRSGLPDTHIHTFASRLHDRDSADRYVDRRAYERYLTNNPNNESRFVHPIGAGAWQGQDEVELVANEAKEIVVRGHAVGLPASEDYGRYGIRLEVPPRVQVFELCRFLAETVRERVLATDLERRMSVPPEMNMILQLEEWAHPDLLSDERPSQSQTFRQLADVLVSGDTTLYRPSQPANTHWQNWPEAGRL